MFGSRDRLPIGIDIGNYNIYAAQLKEIKKGLAVRGMWHQELAEDINAILEDEDKLIPVFKGIRQSRRFQGRGAVIKLPSKNIFSFPVRFEVGDGENIEEAILRESAEHLTFPIEDAILDYPSLTPDHSGSDRTYKATIVATPREHINRYVTLLKKAGLVVEAIDFGVSALIRLHHHLFEKIKNIAILCNIGQTQTVLTMVTEDSILGERIIPWGMRALINKILANIELANDPNRARSLLKQYGMVHDDREASSKAAAADDPDQVVMRRAIYQILTPLIDEFVFEFHRMVSYVRSEEKNPFFEGVYLYGQAGLIAHLDCYVEARIGIRTQQVNPLMGEAFALENDQPLTRENAPYAMAMGLAMRKIAWL